VRFFAKGTYTVDSEDGEGTPIEIEGVSEVNTFVTVECVPNYRYQEELPASFVVSPIQAPKVAPINKPITLRANFRENPGTRRLHDKSPCKLPPFPEVEPLVIVERTVRWSVTQPNGVVLRRTGEVLTFTPSLPGDYEVSFSVQGKALLEEGDEEEGEEDILVLVAQINSDLSKITVVRARLMLEVIPQDNRDTTLFQTLEQGTPAFAGSEPKTADNLRARLLIEPDGVDIKKISWFLTGPSSGAYSPPSNIAARVWNLGDLKPQPGLHEFIVKLDFESGPSIEASRRLQIGIRADDIVVIGWIDPLRVPLSTTSVSTDVLLFLPENGEFDNLTQQVLTTSYLGTIAAGNDGRPLAVSSPLSLADKTYIINWMFKYAANNPPPNSFANEQGLADYYNERGGYKLFNRLQIKYLVNIAGDRFEGLGPTINRSNIAVGVTSNPIWGFGEAGRSGLHNGEVVIRNGNAMHQVNDGTPGAAPVSAFNTLAAPRAWNNIGSRIVQGVGLGTGKEVAVQVYPTYYIYKNLRKEREILQAPNPLDNFNEQPYANEFPGGSAPFLVPSD
jgi:hypothetical protein